MTAPAADQIDWPTRASLAALAALAVIGGVVSAWSIARLNGDTDRVKRTVDVLNEARRLQSLVTDAETGQRGYLLTGSDRYLTPYRDARADIDRAYARLAELTTADRVQKRRVKSLRPLIDRKFEELKETIDLYRGGRRDDALEVVRSDRGQRVMQSVRDVTEELIREEQRTLARRDAARDRSRAIGYTTAVTLTLLEIATLAIAVRMLTAYLRAVAAARRRAELASRARGEFLANMSHEIRTPMTAILGYADILRDRVDDPDDEHLVDTINNNGRHLLRILSDILDLAKIDAGHLSVDRRQTALEPLVADLYSTLAVLAGRKSLAFEIEFENPVPRVLNTDAVRLRQVLFNLIGNAIKFTERGHVRVRLSFEEATNDLVVRISDSGVGIEPEKVAAIFEPFEQQDTSATREHEGTGLGLAICQRLAGALGGTISVESEPGLGSTFVLRVDCGDLTDVDLIHATVTVKRSEPPARRLRGDELSCRVLVVDDRREIRFLARRLIESAGGNVVEAENGSEAVKLLGEDDAIGHSIDVCLMDMQMPVMDGYEATRRIRRRGLTLPIIALTANSMVDDRKRCLAAGCSDYLAKPIDSQKLVEKLAAWSRPDKESSQTT